MLDEGDGFAGPLGSVCGGQRKWCLPRCIDVLCNLSLTICFVTDEVRGLDHFDEEALGNLTKTRLGRHPPAL